jgi:hypothetical protein
VSNTLHLSTNTIHLILGSIDTWFHFFVPAKTHGRGLFEMIDLVHKLIVFRLVGFLQSRSLFGFIGMSSRGKNGIAFVLESLFSILKITKSRILLPFSQVDIAFLGLKWSLTKNAKFLTKIVKKAAIFAKVTIFSSLVVNARNGAPATRR